MTLRAPHDPADKAKRDIAAAMKRQLRAAVLACGDGATAYAKWILRDNLGLEPDRIAYCCRRPGSTWTPDWQDVWGQLADQKIDALVNVPWPKWPRYGLSFQSIADYNPVPEAALKAKREKRRKKKAQKERAKANRTRRLFK